MTDARTSGERTHLTAPSLMRMSAATRLSGAAALGALIWLCVFWAVG